MGLHPLAVRSLGIAPAPPASIAHKVHKVSIVLEETCPSGWSHGSLPIHTQRLADIVSCLSGLACHRGGCECLVRLQLLPALGTAEMFSTHQALVRESMSDAHPLVCLARCESVHYTQIAPVHRSSHRGAESVSACCTASLCGYQNGFPGTLLFHRERNLRHQSSR